MECDDSMEIGHGEPTGADSNQPFEWPHPLPPYPEPFSNGHLGHEGFLWASDMFRAKALEADHSKWIVFDSAESGVEELENFLQINEPSVLKRSDGIGWISVLGPRFHEDRPSRRDDRIGLKEAWEVMEDSGRPITSDTLLDLARAYGCLSGKWFFSMESGFKINHAWAKVARGVVSGQFGMSAKVSPLEQDNGIWKRHVICVYNSNFNDHEEVYLLEDALRKAGIKCRMTYKPDAFTYMGIYRDNKWKIRPSLYSSDYDLNLGMSKPTAVPTP